MLRCFEAVLALRINFSKSIMFSVGEVINVNMLSRNLDCGVGIFPASYLGLPLGQVLRGRKFR